MKKWINALDLKPTLLAAEYFVNGVGVDYSILDTEGLLLPPISNKKALAAYQFLSIRDIMRRVLLYLRQLLSS